MRSSSAVSTSSSAASCCPGRGTVSPGTAPRGPTSTWPGVPGAFEIPLVAQKLAATKRYDAVICLGAVIRGSTPHFDYVSGEVAKGVAKVQLDAGLPVIFGVLTTDSIEQAVERAGHQGGQQGLGRGRVGSGDGQPVQEPPDRRRKRGRERARILVEERRGAERSEGLTGSAAGRVGGLPAGEERGQKTRRPSVTLWALRHLAQT